MTVVMLEPAEKTLNRFAQTIFDKSGFNILALDVREISTMTDYFLIAEGNVDRHVMALMRYVVEEGEKQGVKLIHSEGGNAGDWIVLDFGDIVVHLFLSEVREHYALEELWSEGKIVDLDLKI